MFITSILIQTTQQKQANNQKQTPSNKTQQAQQDRKKVSMQNLYNQTQFENPSQIPTFPSVYRCFNKNYYFKKLLKNSNSFINIQIK